MKFTTQSQPTQVDQLQPLSFLVPLPIQVAPPRSPLDTFLDLVAQAPGDAWSGLRHALIAFGCLVTSADTPGKLAPQEKADQGDDDVEEPLHWSDSDSGESASRRTFDWRRWEHAMLQRQPIKTMTISDPAGRSSKTWQGWLQRAAVLQMRLDKPQAGDVCFQSPTRTSNGLEGHRYMIRVGSGEPFAYQLLYAYKSLLNRYAPRSRRNDPREWQDVVSRFAEAVFRYDPRNTTGVGLAGFVANRRLAWHLFVSEPKRDLLGGTQANPVLDPSSPAPDGSLEWAGDGTGDDDGARDFDPLDWMAANNDGFDLSPTIEQESAAQEAAETTRGMLEWIESQLKPKTTVDGKREHAVWARLRSIRGVSATETVRLIADELRLSERTVDRCLSDIITRVRAARVRPPAPPSAPSPARAVGYGHPMASDMTPDCSGTPRTIDGGVHCQVCKRPSRTTPEQVFPSLWASPRRCPYAIVAAVRSGAHLGRKCGRVIPRRCDHKITGAAIVRALAAYRLDIRHHAATPCTLQRDGLGNPQLRGRDNGGRPYWHADWKIRQAPRIAADPVQCQACASSKQDSRNTAVPRAAESVVMMRRDTGHRVPVAREPVRGNAQPKVELLRTFGPAVPVFDGGCRKPVLRAGLWVPLGCGGMMRQEVTSSTCFNCGWSAETTASRDEAAHICESMTSKRAGGVCVAYPSCSQRRIDQDLTAKYPYSAADDKLDRSWANVVAASFRPGGTDSGQAVTPDFDTRLQAGVRNILSEGAL